ncbi:hypothetical protein Hamer_G018726 [Homarus americanus]|uniref:Uncharacterized protein n=1 Tax=Homarus americanus TaxID=6706 RepID=A0A8J5JIA0_HOMAM|nr:hypothetical protein Hamer_G018726 [Homarus americanus]
MSTIIPPKHIMIHHQGHFHNLQNPIDSQDVCPGDWLEGTPCSTLVAQRPNWTLIRPESTNLLIYYGRSSDIHVEVDRVPQNSQPISKIHLAGSKWVLENVRATQGFTTIRRLKPKSIPGEGREDLT